MPEASRVLGFSPAALRSLVLYVLLSIAALLHLQSGENALLAGAYGWWLALSFVLLQGGVGIALLRRLRPGLLEGEAGLPVAVASGTFVSLFLLAIFAAVGVLGDLGMLVYWLAAAGLGVPALVARFRESAGATVEPAEGSWRRTGLFWFAALCAFPYLVQTLLPDSDWDAAQYHLPMAQAFLDQGLWSTEYGLNAQYRPGTAHLIYALFFASGGEQAVVPINLLAIALTGWTLLRLGAAAFASESAGRWGLGVFLSANIVLELGLDARVEPFLIWWFTVASLAMLRWTSSPGERGWLLLAGAMAGLVAGTKYNGLIYLMVLCVLLALLLLQQRQELRGHLGALALAAGLAVFPGSLWYVRNAAVMGDPLYPMLSGEKHVDRDGTLRPLSEKELWTIPIEVRPPEFFDDTIEEAHLDPTIRKTANRHSYLAIVEALWRREVYTDKKLHWVSPFLLLFLLVPVFDRSRRALLLVGLALGSYLAVATESHVLRYMTPIFPLFGLGAGLVLARMARSGAVRGLFLLALGLWIAHNAYAEYGKLYSLAPQRYLDDREDTVGFLSNVGFNGTPEMAEMSGWVNEQVQAGEIGRVERVLMVAEAKGRLLECRFEPSISAVATDWVAALYRANHDYGELHRDLWDQGFRYLLVNRGWMLWNVRNTQVNRFRIQRALASIDGFVQDRAELAHQVSGLELYRLRKPER